MLKRQMENLNNAMRMLLVDVDIQHDVVGTFACFKQQNEKQMVESILGEQMHSVQLRQLLLRQYWTFCNTSYSETSYRGKHNIHACSQTVYMLHLWLKLLLLMQTHLMKHNSMTTSLCILIEHNFFFRVSRGAYIFRFYGCVLMQRSLHIGAAYFSTHLNLL